MDIWQYFLQRQREIEACSLTIPEHVDLFAAEAGDERRGKLFGCVEFACYPPSVYMQVHEEIVIEGTGISRPRYACFLVIDGREIGGFERHLTHDPAVHKHCSGHKNHEASPWHVVSFKQAAETAWEYVSAFATPLVAKQARS